MKDDEPELTLTEIIKKSPALDHDKLVELNKAAEKRLQDTVNETNPIALYFLKKIFPKLKGYERTKKPLSP